MKKIAIVIAAAGLISLGACKQQTPAEADVNAAIANMQAEADNMGNTANAMAANVSNEVGAATSNLNDAADKLRAEAANTTAPAK